MSSTIKLKKHPQEETKVKARKTEKDIRLIRLTADTDQKMLQLLTRINDKEAGRKIRANDLISLALDLVQTEHITKLQESSLTNYDRFEMIYKSCSSKDKTLTKDQLLGQILSGDIKDGLMGQTSPLGRKRRTRLASPSLLQKDGSSIAPVPRHIVDPVIITDKIICWQGQLFIVIDWPP
jgi:hypothetical protein